jgi:PAS domain S-box-containing protein
MKSSRFTSRDERSVEIPFTENISYKQARNAVFVAIVLGILFSLAQIVLDLRNEKNSVATAVHQILSTAKDTAAEAAFNLDKELGQRTINGLLAYQPIFKATIRDELGAVIAHGEHTHTPVGPHYILHFLSDFTFGDVSYFTTPLILTGDRDIPAGEMTVWADAHVIAANFLGRVWMVLVFGLLRNIILALILTGVFFLTFTKPLVQSVNALRAIRRPTEQELFQAPVPKGHERDEIGQLVQSINALTADIHESEERFKDLAMHSIQGIVVHRNQKPLFANEAAARIFGFDSHDEILSLDTLEQSIAPHERERIAGYIEKRMSGEQAPETYEFEGRRVDGRGVWILNTVRVIDWKGEVAPVFWTGCEERVLGLGKASFRGAGHD